MPLPHRLHSYRLPGRPILLTLLVASGGLSNPASAADWAQFRGDARKTAASTDRVALPLVTLWSQTNTVTGPSLWKGRCFVLGAKGTLLQALDARTGSDYWTVSRPPSDPPISSLTSCVAVSDAGLVILPGRCTLWKDRTSIDGMVAYNAYTGKLVAAAHPVPHAPSSGHVPQVIPSIRFEPDFRGWVYDHLQTKQEILLHSTGSPTVHGQSVVATGTWQGLFLWRPGEPLNLWGLHTGKSLSWSHLSTQSVPVTLTDVGFAFGIPNSVLSGGGSNRRLDSREFRHRGSRPPNLQEDGLPSWRYRGPVLLMLHHNTAPRWWRIDLPHVGTITYDQYTLFTRTQNRIIAIDASNGQTRWIFPRSPFVRQPEGKNWYGYDSGLVAKDHKIYGEADNSLVCLDQRTGHPLWRLRLHAPLAPHSLVASRDYLFACEGQTLIAVDAKTGARLWRLPLSRKSSIAVANGMLYVSTSRRLDALAPAERTFRLALDSPHPDDYSASLGTTDLIPPPDEPDKLAETMKPECALPPQIEVSGPQAGMETDPSPEELKPALPGDTRAVADASVLRLPVTEAEATLLQRARTRRQQCGDVPLLLSLEWLDARRSRALLLPNVELRERCRRLAAAVQPEYFDLAPDLNVYLTFQPDRAEALRQWITEARAAIRQVSPGTRVLVSLNREVLSRIYGNGKQRPFGELPARRLPPETLQPFLEVVDAVGLTSHPQSALASYRQIPGDYFLSVKNTLPAKPLLLTDLVLHAASDARLELWSRRLIQTAYWLNAELLVYPDLRGEVPAVAPPLGRERPLPVLGAWADVPFWKRVQQLTAAPESFK